MMAAESIRPCCGTPTDRLAPSPMRRHDYVVIDAQTTRAAADAADYAADDYAERANYEDKTDGDEGSEFQDAADRYSTLAASLRASHDRLEF